MQKGHEYRLSPVWVIRWCFKFCFLLRPSKSLPQTTQDRASVDGMMRDDVPDDEVS